MHACVRACVRVIKQFAFPLNVKDRCCINLEIIIITIPLFPHDWWTSLLLQLLHPLALVPGSTLKEFR